MCGRGTAWGSVPAFHIPGIPALVGTAKHPGGEDGAPTDGHSGHLRTHALPPSLLPQRAHLRRLGEGSAQASPLQPPGSEPEETWPSWFNRPHHITEEPFLA